MRSCSYFMNNQLFTVVLFIATKRNPHRNHFIAADALINMDAVNT